MLEDKNKKNTHGGKRVGAGRKTKTEKKKRVRIFFCLSEEEEKILKPLADKEGLSIGQYARKVALKNTTIKK